MRSMNKKQSYKIGAKRLHRWWCELLCIRIFLNVIHISIIYDCKNYYFNKKYLFEQNRFTSLRLDFR